MNKKLVLKREVRKLAGKFPFDSEKEGWKGKSYYRFAYDESVFTVHEDDDFIQDWNDNKVYQIKLGISDAGGALLNYFTREQMMEDAKFERELEEISNFVPKAVAPQDAIG